jgi:hypothetical protein
MWSDTQFAYNRNVILGRAKRGNITYGATNVVETEENEEDDNNYRMPQLSRGHR